MLKKLRVCKLSKDADIKLFDAFILAEKGTIDRFTDAMQTDWDVKEVNQDSKIRREKLIEKMVKIQQEKCEVTMCDCIEKERQGNLLSRARARAP